MACEKNHLPLCLQLTALMTARAHFKSEAGTPQARLRRAGSFWRGRGMGEGLNTTGSLNPEACTGSAASTKETLRETDRLTKGPGCPQEKSQGQPPRVADNPRPFASSWLVSESPSYCPVCPPAGLSLFFNPVAPTDAVTLGTGTGTEKSGLSKTPPHSPERTPSLPLTRALLSHSLPQRLQSPLSQEMCI